MVLGHLEKIIFLQPDFSLNTGSKLILICQKFKLIFGLFSLPTCFVLRETNLYHFFKMPSRQEEKGLNVVC